MNYTESVEMSTTTLINENKVKIFLTELAKDIKNGDKQSADIKLKTLQEKGNPIWLKEYKKYNTLGESLLHLTIKKHYDEKFVRQLSELCPRLLCADIRKSKEFLGQTALHISITKGNAKATKTMLEIGQEKLPSNQMTTLLQTKATGSRFVNTVMMGQLPLTVAALKGNKKIIKYLLKFGAELQNRNEEGDTVFHSLVKYAAIYPEKVIGIVEIVRYLNEKVEFKIPLDENAFEDIEIDEYRPISSFVWFLKNNENLTPLQLAAKHGVSKLFEEILNLKDIYCFIRENDGLFDVKEYDITEIDTVSNNRSSRASNRKMFPSKKTTPENMEGVARKKVDQAHDTQCMPCVGQCCAYPETESILEMLFTSDYESKDAYRIIELMPVKNIILMKWKRYQFFFGLLMLFHYVFVILLTTYSVYNVCISVNGNKTTTWENEFVSAFRWVSFCAGVLYFFIAISILITKIFKKRNILHNLEYIIPMMILAVSMIVDVLWSIAEEHDNIPLIVAVICGWWLNVFFLSPFKYFSFFTELIKRVIIGDLIRFGLVIVFILVSFSAAMFIAFRGTEKEDFASFSSTMMAMFKLGVGIEDISVISSARIPVVATVIFIVFTVFTYLLMLNALIAMMSQTCSLVLEEQYPQWRLQQLSVVLFIEDILCLCCFHNILSSVGSKTPTIRYDPITKQMKQEDRYYLEIHSLQMEYATAEEKIRVKKKSNEIQTLLLQSDEQLANPMSLIRQSLRDKVGDPLNHWKKKIKDRKYTPLENLDEMQSEEETEETGHAVKVSPNYQIASSSKTPSTILTPDLQLNGPLNENGKKMEPPFCRVSFIRVPHSKNTFEYDIRTLSDS